MSNNNFTDESKITNDLKPYAKKACSYQIMWKNGYSNIVLLGATYYINNWPILLSLIDNSKSVWYDLPDNNFSPKFDGINEISSGAQISK